MSANDGDAGAITFRSADHRQLCLAAGVVAIPCFALVLRRAAHDHYPIDGLFFVAIVSIFVVAVLLLAGSRVVLGRGELTIVNGVRRHRLRVADLESIDVVNLGDHDVPVPPPLVRRTALVRLTTREGHVHAVALLCEPALRRRSSGIDGLEAVVAELRRAVSQRR